jgi:YidC/Oxa1 family membrane protein insertase
VVLFVAACTTLPGATTPPGVSPSPSPTPPPPLEPAQPGSNPISLLAWLFTPVFWLLFNILVVFDKLTGNIAIAIVILTLLIRVVLISPFRRQIVSQKRMQLIGPEVKELQKKFKGDRAKQMEAQQRLYRERGVSPTSGCLPMLLQFVLLIPMYSVISQGLTSWNPQAMTPIDLNCPASPTWNAATDRWVPCLNPVAFGIDWSVPEVLFALVIPVSALGILAAALQLLQSRMTLPPVDASGADPTARTQRQMFLILPLLTVFYGGILPAGLVLYWIVSTIFSIGQQYLIVGWGSVFPLFGYTPGFARDHKPRFPVQIPPVVKDDKDERPSIAETVDRSASASKTIRPRQRGRQGRRGRRR